MIEIEHLTKRYGAFTAVEDITFDVPDGTVHGLVGHNGAGKTTLLKTIAGVYLADGGAIRIDGKPLKRKREPEEVPFIVADDPYFVSGATLVRMRDFYAGYYPHWSDGTFANLIELFGLDDRAPIAGYSKGMQRQAAILLGLSTGAHTVLMDESFDGLDLYRRRMLRKLLHGYARKRRASVILSSHDLREIEDVADDIGMIEDHHLIFDGDVAGLHERYRRCTAVFPIPVPEGYEAKLRQIADVRWVRLEVRPDTAEALVTMVLAGDAGASDDALASMGARAITTAPATLEEIFLSGEEAVEHELEGIFV